MKNILIYILLLLSPTLLLSNTSPQYYVQTDSNISNNKIMENEDLLFLDNSSNLKSAIIPQHSLWIKDISYDNPLIASSKYKRLEGDQTIFYHIDNPSLSLLIDLENLLPNKSEINLTGWISINSFYYGVMFSLLIYVIFFSYIFKHKSFLYYSYTHIALMVFLLDADGWLQKIFWDAYPMLSTVTIPITMALSISLIAIFSRMLLSTRELSKKIDTILILLILINIISSLLIFFVSSDIASMAIEYISFVTLVYLIYTTLYILLTRQYKSQRYFVVLWEILLLSLFVEYLRYLDYIPSNILTSFIFKIVILFELIAISMATISQRYKQLEKEIIEVKESAKENALKLSQMNFDEKRLQQKHDLLNKLAGTDGLTGLYNRREYFNICESLIFRAKNEFAAYSMMMLDLDHFKNVNDTYGHDIGDVVLKTVTKAITEAKREDDVFGRIGGEEFAFFMPNTSASEAEEIANSFCQLVSKLQIDTGKEIIKITVSIGLASDSHRQFTLSELMKSSDVALYEAKASGRNKVVSVEAIPR